ncbi:MAG: phosphotransferase family protein [Acidimicrobiales bacterium mtb01]|nr:phosphotransferase family protein [Actinomycetota bacterium]TEX46452.1 MAG: phosphotransferase family protein [Acidimicrobiales bacterium mtb01]
MTPGVSVQGIDVDKVSAWLVENIGGARAPFVFDLIAGGRSNLTFRVTDANGTHYVLRRPPLGHVLATAHDMAREYKIIAAVGRTNVPVPPALGVCTDDSVNGAPFYVMGFVNGVVLDSADKAALLDPSLRETASHHLIDVMADLHAVDVDAVGLGDLARRDGYIERQLKRWKSQWENSKTRELAAIDEVARRLSERVPVQQGTVIAHGDYRFGNCLTDVKTGRIAAVLDWELCTLGDPLADLGYLGVYWADPSNPQFRANDPTPAGGFPTYRSLVDRYAARTGRDVSGIDYYVAFSCWRLAVISEGVYARYLHGAMGKQEGVDLAALKLGPEGLAERALESVRRLS